MKTKKRVKKLKQRVIEQDERIGVLEDELRERRPYYLEPTAENKGKEEAMTHEETRGVDTSHSEIRRPVIDNPQA